MCFLSANIWFTDEPKYKYGQQEQVTVIKPQQKYCLETVSIKILGGLNQFYGLPSSPSSFCYGSKYIVSCSIRVKVFYLINVSSRETNKPRINTMMRQRWGRDRNNVLRPTPGDPWGVEQQHWNTGGKESHPIYLRFIVPLVSFGTPWPNKQNHKTLHFQNFLNEKFNAASIKITVFKIKSHFTEYSSVILNLSIILAEICIFFKIFKQMQILQKQKEICIFSARLLHSVKCWYIIYLIPNCFWTNKRTTKFICFLKFLKTFKFSISGWGISTLDNFFPMPGTLCRNLDFLY